MANKWLEALKAKNAPREGAENPDILENLLDKIDKNNRPSIEGSSENPDIPENPLDKIDKNTEKPKKKTKKKKLSPEEVYEKTHELADEWSGYVINDARARECLVWAKETDAVEIDIETYGKLKRDGLLYTRCKIRLIILHHDEKLWFVDCHYVSSEMVREILLALAKPDTRKIFHNALFDVPRLYKRYGVLLDQDLHDTMIASRVARAGEWEWKRGRVVQKSYSLGDCIKRELDVEIPKDTKHKWGGLLTDDHLTYAGDDVYNLQDLHHFLEGTLEKHGVLGRYEAIRGCLPDFIGAAVRGVPLDAERLQPILDTYAKEVEDLRTKLDELAPDHPEGAGWIWGNTSKETTPEGKGRQGALRALSLVGVEISDLQDQTLLDHRDDHEIVGVLYDYRKKSNTLSRYRKWLPDFYDPETGRFYPQPKVAAAVTGRVLYSDPNAQGIDKKKTKEFRKVVRAPAGRAIVKGDFAQQELRIAAYFSEDRAMLNAFADGRDIYQEVAKALVGHEVSKDDPARDAAKRATLGFLYGLGVDKYRQNVYKDTQERLSGKQAVKDRQAFRAAFPTFYNWQRRYGSRHEWETRSVLGWRRVVAPGYGWDGDMVPKYTDRLNGPIQSTAGDILYLTLEKMAEDPRPNTHFLLSVHDELVLECPEDDAREVALWLGEKMRSAIEGVLGKALGGPKSVEVGYGPSWGETTEVKLS